MCRIESYNGLRELENAWALLPHFYDTTKIVSGIFICIAHRGITMRTARCIADQSVQQPNTVRMLHLHTFRAVEYWGKGLEVFILRNGSDV